MVELTKGAAQLLSNGEKPVDPILQCMGWKKMSLGGTDRYRVMLSDGVHLFGSSMLAPSANRLIVEGKMEQHTVVKLTNYQTSTIQGTKRLIICQEIEIVKSAAEVGGRIGDPITIKKGAPDQNNQNVTNENKKPVSNLNGQPPSSMYSPKPTGKRPFGRDDTPVTPGGSQTRVMPIASLTPYQNKWSIKARVTQKGAVKEWKNARGEGKLFNFTVIDESGDIRITCFKEEADKYFDLCEVGKVYYIANGTLKPANQQYNNTSHDYEMTFRRDSMMNVCEASDSKTVPTLQYNFKPIANLEQSVNSLVDVIGVVKSTDEVSTIMIKSQNREAKLRKFTIVDTSSAEVTVTLWGTEAEKFDGSNNPVVALKAAKVSDFNGCSLSTMGSTMLTVSPDIPEAYKLKQWFETGGSTQSVHSLTTSGGGGGSSGANWKTLADIKTENLGHGDKPDYITSKVTVLYCKPDNVLYQACSTEGCNKKVTEEGGGQYRCEKCDQVTSSFKYRMMLNLNVADEYDSTWVTCFQDQGEILLGITSQELGSLKENDESAFTDVLKKVNFQSYFLKMRIKADRFNDEERIRATVVNVSPISNVDYIKKLTADIEKLRAQ